MSVELRSLFVSLLKAALVAYLIACVAACAFQSRLIWFPGGPPRTAPSDYGLAHREVELTTGDGVRLHAWRIDAPEPRGIVVYCHGNAGSIEQRIDAAEALVRLGASVLLFDYRGYGRSAGRPSEEGTYLDAEAAWEAATREAGFPPERVIAWGESLGGAVAIELARRRTVGGLVTEAAFTSLPDVAAVHYRWLPVRWIARVQYASLDKVPGLRVPWLLLHSPDDEIVPFDHAERLLAAARAGRDGVEGAAPVELVRTAARHNDGGFLRAPAAAEAIGRLLDRVLGPRS